MSSSEKTDTKEVSPTTPSSTDNLEDVKATSAINASQESLSSNGYGSSDEHVFSDPSVANHWRGVYEKASYENRHRFDPDFKWTAEEEKKVLRKIDLRIMVWAWVMFFALDVHRRNIQRAITDKMLPETGTYLATAHLLPSDHQHHIKKKRERGLVLTITP